MRRFLRSGHDPIRERLKRDLFQFNKVHIEDGTGKHKITLSYKGTLVHARK